MRPVPTPDGRLEPAADGKGPGTQVIVAPTGAIRGWSRKQLCHMMRMLQTRGSGPEIPSRPQCPSSLTVLNLVTPLMLSLCSPYITRGSWSPLHATNPKFPDYLEPGKKQPSGDGRAELGAHLWIPSLVHLLQNILSSPDEIILPFHFYCLSAEAGG